MHHRDETGYRHFCALIARKPTADNRECIQHVMRATGGTSDPNMVADWWKGWQIMKGSRATSGYSVRFFRDSNGKDWWCEMGPVNQPDAWDCGALPLEECIRWAQDLISEMAQQDAALAQPHTHSPSPAGPE